jgi:CHASE2 domain-containing sensor protein
MKEWIAKQGKALGQKKWSYWVRAAVVVIIGVILGDRLSESNLWLEQRRTTYRLLHKLIPRESHPKWVALILIEDDEYWLGALAGRTPVRRDYLARLTRSAISGNPALVALDFSLRSPSPDGNPIEHSDYQQETEILLNTIREIGLKCPVVVSKTLGPEENDGYTTDSDIYDRYDFSGATVLKGYITLPFDERLVPAVPMPLQNGGKLDSFAGAIVRGVHPELLTDGKDAGETLPYGDFIDLEKFVRVSARDVLRNDPATLSALAHRLVIIGAHWHSDALGRWDFIDLHGSPNGEMPGVALHANYVEAILDSRLHAGWNSVVLHIIEGLGAALVVFAFALEIRPMIKALTVIALACVLIVVSAFSLLVLGLVFDFFVPVVSAIGHGLFERVLEWRDAALARSTRPQQSPA